MKRQIGEMRSRSGKRTVVIWSVLAGLTAILAANAHLVYVAMKSDPECVLDNSDVETTDKIYRPVKSGC